ncbi:MAG: alpha/beta hydrolase [Caulobacterales bacterium]
MITGPTSHTFISQRLRLRYVDWGNPDAPPLVLVHGGRDHCRSWDWAAQELRKDWHVIAPDLRGHGESDWSPDGEYGLLPNVYDLAQLVHQLGLAPVTIVGHSYGGNVSTRYTGVYPENVRKLVSIEGLGSSPKKHAEEISVPINERIRKWIEARRGVAARSPRRYATLEDAYKRMKDENRNLSDEQSRHLTIHGVSQNEDGTYSWKFDNYMHLFPPFEMAQEDLHTLWASITCPTLLMYGADSWASNPEKDGRATHFQNARVVLFEKAGHWLHHDQFDRFMQALRGFL